MLFDEVLTLGLADSAAHVQAGEDLCLAIAGVSFVEGRLPVAGRQALGLAGEQDAGALGVTWAIT
uniref:Uncharacterized protein n=1 Tax=Phenylobacterium glaciei TaxID=2803784 RepID=A0A974P639_9CAUL|nr:hypothetical protein JKL49_12685 [Phenylobacterium glaciei]